MVMMLGVLGRYLGLWIHVKGCQDGDDVRGVVYVKGIWRCWVFWVMSVGVMSVWCVQVLG